MPQVTAMDGQFGTHRRGAAIGGAFALTTLWGRHGMVVGDALQQFSQLIDIPRARCGVRQRACLYRLMGWGGRRITWCGLLGQVVLQSRMPELVDSSDCAKYASRSGIFKEVHEAHGGNVTRIL
jgi:hypothetical protein